MTRKVKGFEIVKTGGKDDRGDDHFLYVIWWAEPHRTTSFKDCQGGFPTQAHAEDRMKFFVAPKVTIEYDANGKEIKV